ncbi:MAG TPA: choloylglycine hydrolase [Candidatus Barnesiella excrementipullorum]|uniref:Choloylglycine hydrolase n=1 Tax=Candidatus Barnesiella excrementipullorum TaxID=2838479 RepID=A0A9D1VR78_9BACT|nr:choloylglycine hydrolase [Candidatus Barnesiella excrementipullorum]
MRKFLKITAIIIAIPVGLLVLLVAAAAILYQTADMKEPAIEPARISHYALTDSAGCRIYNGNILRRNSDGLWEMYIRGDAFARGEAAGILADSLLYYQESVFVDQIRDFIPSESYLNFLRYIIILFNRDLGNNVTEEYRTEIAAMARSCTHEYDFIGTPYERQLNYHAAHDIGHLMQDYMLVGCSSFAVWESDSADSTLLIGRNFDFYMGDNFARNKLITFCEPDSGYRFASIGWPGMVGVLSGMNETGLTVTINAAKGTLPRATATPISILAREILQYAATIDEAYDIARRRKTFVSESLLIGSARDGIAAVIEKSPDRIALYTTDDDRIACTNHYQSESFANDERNIENIRTSDSKHRLNRLLMLTDSLAPLTPARAAAILRDYRDEENRFIGLCNELSINQCIAHHSVIFAPEKHIMWVSTAPWQAGKYIAYNLDSIFYSDKPLNKRFDTDIPAIAADTAFLAAYYDDIVAYRRLVPLIRNAAHTATPLPADTLQCFLTANPDFYHTHELLGDYYFSQGNRLQAIAEWEKALQLAIPKEGERRRIEEKLKETK